MEKKIWCTGKGDTIIFIHGLVGNHTVFKEQINQFSTNYQVVTYDIVGHGDKSGQTVDFTMDNLVHELATIYERAQIQRAHICSLSFGTYIANEFTFHYPKRVASLCHIGGSYNNPSLFYSALEELWWKKDKEYRDWLQYYAFKMNPNNRAMPDPYAYKSRMIFQKYGSLVSSIIVKQALHYMLFHDAKSKLKEITQPTLWITGEYDNIRKTCLYDLHDVLPQVKYVELLGVPHVAHLYKPKLFYKAYQEFLSEMKGAALA